MIPCYLNRRELLSFIDVKRGEEEEEEEVRNSFHLSLENPENRESLLRVSFFFSSQID